MNGARILVAAVALAASGPARATAAVKLTYDAPPECPSEAQFVAAVTARGADFDTPRAARVPPVMVVSIARAQDGFAGAFGVRDAGEATNKREVHGADCHEVCDALAVVTAIALQGDAGAGGEAAAPQPLPPSLAPELAALPEPAPAPPASPPPSDDRLQGRTRVFPRRTEVVTVPAGKVRFDIARTATLSAGAAVGVVPSVTLPLYDLSFTGAMFVTTPDGRQRITGPVFRLHVGLLGPGTYDSPNAKTDLWGGIFSVDLCQSPSYDTRGLVLLFCGGYGGGFVQMTTNEVGSPTQMKTSGFGSVMFSGEIQVHLAGPLLLGAKLAGGFKLGQITAERADGTRIFASSMGAAEGTLGVGIRY